MRRRRWTAIQASSLREGDRVRISRWRSRRVAAVLPQWPAAAHQNIAYLLDSESNYRYLHPARRITIRERRYA